MDFDLDCFRRPVTVLNNYSQDSESSIRAKKYFEDRYNSLLATASQTSAFDPYRFEIRTPSSSYHDSEDLNRSFSEVGTQTDDSDMQVSLLFETPPHSPSIIYKEDNINPGLARRDPKLFCKMVLEEIEKFRKAPPSVDDFIEWSQCNRTVDVFYERQFEVKKNASSCDKLLNEALKTILMDETLIYQGDELIVRSKKMCDTIVKEKIYCIFKDVVESIKKTGKYKIQVRSEGNWQNVLFKNDMLVMKPIGKAKMATITMKRSGLLLAVLHKIYSMLTLDICYTSRSIYYQFLDINELSAVQVNKAIMTVSNWLEMPTWNLGILSGKSGQVYGNLKLYFSDSNVDCECARGSAIPVNLMELTRIESNAYFILIIEKDTIFQKLISDNLKSKLAQPFIMVTARGYGDINTRLFLKMLWKMLKIPIFALVDADPYGIEIMLSYRFGSLSTSFLSEELALPSLRWLGVFPSELNLLKIRKIKLQSADLKKISHLLTRPYMDFYPKIKEEILAMKKTGYKAEIEGLLQHNKVLSGSYLPNRLFYKMYI